MGTALRGNTRTGGAGKCAVARWLTRWRALLAACAPLLLLSPAVRAPLEAQLPVPSKSQSSDIVAPDVVRGQDAPRDVVPHTGVRLDSGRFTFVAEKRDVRLAQALLNHALTQDSFPGLPRPSSHVLVAIAPDAKRFREWVGPSAPEWGAAIAIPELQRIVMQGGDAGSDAGDPLVVLRHELAHLALHEAMGSLPPRWFDEGYASFAAHEWTRDATIETSSGMIWRTLPTLEQLEDGFYAGESRANWSYALAYRAVDELASLDPVNGLTNLFREWKSAGAFEPAVRHAFGMTGEQFDKHWHKQTRRRFGALALVTNVSAALGFFVLLLGPLFWMRRKRDRRRLEVMRAADEAQERAARESALEAILLGGVELLPELGGDGDPTREHPPTEELPPELSEVPDDSRPR